MENTTLVPAEDHEEDGECEDCQDASHDFDDDAIRYGNNRKHQTKEAAKAKRKAQRLARRKNRAKK